VPQRVRVVLLALTLATLTVSGLTRLSAQPGSAAPMAADPLNVVLITADDMRAADLQWMPRTRELFAQHGMTFRNGIAPHPLCCPARAQILTGQYAQNNGVLSNAGAYGGFRSLRKPGNHVGAWLASAGYDTAFVGKYLNGYRWERDGRQSGWTHWDATIKGIYSYGSFTQTNDGEPIDITDGYVTDYVRNATTGLIRTYAGGGAPFFIWSSYVAPHNSLVVDPSGIRTYEPPIPAPRHVGRYAGVPADVLSKPAFNEAAVGDKPSTVRRPQVSVAEVQQEFTGRIESLAAVDEAVAATFGALDDEGVLDRTLLIFTSDNGYLLGEHRVVGKRLAYEEALRIPFLVAGPSLASGTQTGRTVSLLDISATIVDAANAVPGRRLDGASFLGAVPTDSAQRTLLVQAGNRLARRGDRRWDFRGIRHKRYTYVRWYTGEEELYDRRTDPHQLVNKAEKRRYRDVRGWAFRVTRRLDHCAGASCRRAPSPPPRIRS
jgi:arylsulfatase A-like enzyme